MTRGKWSLLLAGAAVAGYGIYRYSKLSSTEKRDLQTRGKDLLNKGLSSARNLIHRNKAATNTTPVQSY